MNESIKKMIPGSFVHTNSGKFDFCPYCRGSMWTWIVNEEYKEPEVVFICGCCGTRSPAIAISPDMLDLNKVEERMNELIDVNKEGE